MSRYATPHGALLFGSALLGLALSPACKGKEAGPQSAPKAAAGEEAQKAQSLTGSKETGMKTGGHLRMPSNEPRFLNPVLEVGLNLATPLIFEGLVGLNNKRESVPRLAESYNLSADAKTLTFKLRKGVTWHDGKPFTAADVKFTYEAIRDTKRPTLWKAYMAAVQSVETPNAHTVIIKYAKPYAPAVKTWVVGILPKHIYEDVASLEKNRANREPVGTGPYRLARWEPGKRILLNANKKWWNKRPNLDSIELVLNVPPASYLEALRKGDLDFAPIVSIEEWSEAQLPEFRSEFEVSNFLESTFAMITWNILRPKFEDKRVRQALTFAVNRNAILDDLLLGQAQLLSAPFFPTMFGADRSIAPRAFDPSQAEDLLATAVGKPKANNTVFSFEIIAPKSQRSTSTEAFLAMYRRDLKSIGVEVSIAFLPTRTFLERLVLREFDAAYVGWAPDIADPDPYALLHSSQIGAGAVHAGLTNPEVDRLLDEARSTADRKKRKALYHQIHAIVHEEVPYTMLFSRYRHYAWNRRLRGVHPGDTGAPQPAFPGIAHWWLDR